MSSRSTIQNIGLQHGIQQNSLQIYIMIFKNMTVIF